MGNRLKWSDIPGIFGQVIDVLINLPGEIAGGVYNYLKNYKSEAAKLASASAQERQDIIAGITSRVSEGSNTSPRVRGEGAPTAGAINSTFATQDEVAKLDGINGDRPSGPERTFSTLGDDYADDLAPTVASAEKDTGDGYVPKSKEEEAKIIELFGADSLSQLFNKYSEKELIDRVEKVTGKKPSATESFDMIKKLYESASTLHSARSNAFKENFRASMGGN